jgi:hypothetical protein
MHLLAIITLTFLLSTDATAAENIDKTKCAAVKEKIKRIRSRMRAGYTRAQGERMEAQLRKLKQQRRTNCR